MSTSCHKDHGDHCHSQKRDWIYLVSFLLITLSYVLGVTNNYFNIAVVKVFNEKTVMMIHEMWWGILLSLLAVGVIHHIPQKFVTKHITSHKGIGGLMRAVIAGVAFDLCSHGILLVGMKLYRRGASLGQTMAFLIASPWNSLSLTFIMIALMGLKLTLCFIVFSIVIAFVSGLIFEGIEKKKIFPIERDAVEDQEDKEALGFRWSPNFIWEVFRDGYKESKVILKWIFIGTLISSSLAVLLTPEMFQNFFGNDIKGMLLTLFSATVIEICSEGSVPVAADLVNIAGAAGNAFIFLMAGVATDLTEILAIRETMKSWKVAFLLPLITVPQILLFGWLINSFL